MAGEDIYAALTKKEWQKVRDLCSKHPEGPFLKLTERKHSVLQKALYSGEVNLVLDLLDDAKKLYPQSQDFKNKLELDVNTRKNNILHVAATQDSCIPAATKILTEAPQLLNFPNGSGESPIFPAVRYGQFKMFKFLKCEFEKKAPDGKDSLSFYKTSGGHESSTILHVAIYNEHFELALYIAKTIPGLICEENHRKMTGLHMLAMNPSAFRNRNWKWLKLLISSPSRAVGNMHEDATNDDVKATAVGSSFTVTSPWWDHIKKENKRYEAALELADILVQEDTKWIESISGDALASATQTNPAAAKDSIKPQTPLILATKYSDDNVADGSPLASNHDNVDANNTVRAPASATQTNPAAAKDSIKPQTPLMLARKYSDDNVADSSALASNHDNVDANNTVRAPASATQTNPSAAKDSIKPPTPLILATKYGCLDIALKIIEKHPQTVEQVGPEYGSLLHLAIKYRRIEIFDAVVNMPMQMRRLVRLRDDDGNSILHMVALNTAKVKDKKTPICMCPTEPNDKSLLPWDSEELWHETRSPAFELQDDLLLFERVEEIIKTHYHKNPNNDLQVADQLFAVRKEALRETAQEWMKSTAQNCAVNAVLIATVAFAAAATVPGGSNGDTGFPILLNQTFFLLFTVADVLSLALTLTAVVVFLSILTSPFRFQDFKKKLPNSLMFGISCIVFSLTMMTLAFAARIILMTMDCQKRTRIALYVVAFLPVNIILVAAYLPFYYPVMPTIYRTVQKVKFMSPRFHVHLSKTRKPKTSSGPVIEV